MGADFIFAIHERIENPEDLREKAKLLSEEDLDRMAEEVLGTDEHDEHSREHILDLLNQGIDIASGQQRRDTGLVRLRGQDYVLTGGMSWGEDPTEACYPLWALEASGLYREEVW